MRRGYVKSFAVLITAAITLTSFMVGCGGNTKPTPEVKTNSSAANSNKDDGLDMSKKITIKHFNTSNIPEKKGEITQILEQKFNVEFETMGVPDKDIAQKLNLLLASGDLPDIFPVFWNEAIMEQGLASMTYDEFKKYAPKTYNYINKFAEESGEGADRVWKTFERKGKFIQIPEIWVGGARPKGMIWRKDTLDELGKNVPTTISEWEEVFKAYKAKYPGKYPYTGTGKQIFQSFFAVTYSNNTPINQWVLKGDKLVFGAAMPEMKDALTVLQKWQKAGYINPEWLMNDSNARKKEFINGSVIVYDYGPLDKCSITEPPYISGSELEECVKLNPQAKFVLAPYPTMKEGQKPMTMVYSPFTGKTWGFGIQLEKDRNKLHRILAMMEDWSFDEETYLLRTFGVKGKHWDMDQNGLPQRKPGFTTSEEQTAINAGYYLTFSTPLGDKFSIQPKVMDAFNKLLAPDGMYGRKTVTYLQTGIEGNRLLNEKGEDLKTQYNAAIEKSRDEMIARIIFGEKPVSAYDEFLTFWKNNGGTAMEEAANKNYADSKKK